VSGASAAVTTGGMADLLAAWSAYLGGGQPTLLPYYLLVAPWVWLLPATSLIVGGVICSKPEVRLETMIYLTTSILTALFLWLSVSVVFCLGILSGNIPIGQ
jgi:hypothetical protein